MGEPGPSGVAGTNGINGQDGKSAYGIYAANNTDPDLSETQWLDSLKGEQGAQGEQGEPGNRGSQGEQGEPGNRGPQGEQGVQGEAGPSGVAGTNGSDGRSAYEIYAANNTDSDLSETEWLASLKGEQGEAGTNANVPQLHLTQAFIPRHPTTLNRQYLVFVTAATSMSSYSGGTSPPSQIYTYKLVNDSGDPTTDDPILQFPDNTNKFPMEEPYLKTAPASYGIVITDCYAPEPIAPARIDIWISDMVESTVLPETFTEILYHFSWSASQEWIFNLWKENGNAFIGPTYPNGIPLLVPTNATIRP